VGREGEAKDRAVVRGGFDPDPAAVVLDDALADGQADGGAGVFLAGIDGNRQSQLAGNDGKLRYIVTRCDFAKIKNPHP